MRFEGRPQPNGCIGTVVYSNAQWAAYAREKFHGFEYPPGQRLIVKPDFDGRGHTSTKHTKPDILQIAETITQASHLIQAAGLSPGAIFIVITINKQIKLVFVRYFASKIGIGSCCGKRQRFPLQRKVT